MAAPLLIHRIKVQGMLENQWVLTPENQASIDSPKLRIFEWCKEKQDDAHLPFFGNELGYEDQPVDRQETKDGGNGNTKRGEDKKTRYWRDFLDFCYNICHVGS